MFEMKWQSLLCTAVNWQLRNEIKDSLTRQGMQNHFALYDTRGLCRKGLAEREKNKPVLTSERAHKQA